MFAIKAPRWKMNVGHLSPDVQMTNTTLRLFMQSLTDLTATRTLSDFMLMLAENVKISCPACFSSAYSVTTLPGSPNKMLNVSAVTRFTISPAVRLAARAASRIILIGPLGSNSVVILQTYSISCSFPPQIWGEPKLNTKDTKATKVWSVFG